MARVSLVGAIVRGCAAGIAAGFVQTLFFKGTGKIAPALPAGAFEPPEEIQKTEMPTHTVARRLVENFMQREPLSDDAKARAGDIVHYSYSALWGGLYAAIRESYPRTASPVGAIG